MFETQKTGSQSETDIFFDPKMKNMFIQSPNKHLNTFLGGGMHQGMITQIYGEAGSGKTQAAMLFALGVNCV